MREVALDTAIKEICAKDNRYAPDGYYFVLESLDFTLKMLDRPSTSVRERHISGRELLEGIRNFAIEEFGPMALRVLRRWGITRTEDFGEIVFNLVDSGKLRRTAEDSRKDFANGYDFDDAFVHVFRPKSKDISPPESSKPPRTK